MVQDSPPVSPKTVRHGKRSRHSSGEGELSLEELSADDIGYDGDIEVVRPDQIEEPESDFEDGAGSLGIKRLLWPDTDEELANKLKRLSWHSKRPRAKSLHGHEDRPTTPPQQNTTSVNQHGKRTELEVSEMMDGHNSAPPAKRRKRKDSRLTVAQRLMGHNRCTAQTDTSERTDGNQTSMLESSGSAALPTKVVPMESNEMDLD